MKPVLVISERDNVATALQALEPGRDLTFARGRVSVVDAVPSGHKIALCAIHAGEAVIKYGSPIGLATAEIAAGAHVHTHNLASQRGRGPKDKDANDRDDRQPPGQEKRREQPREKQNN